ncbi:MAG: right-handed parallel beta-helix repeat-containing protein [Acidobacteriota bacterium]|nr:right-handed parallel beta-helix repeat-containing protein [Acidobacteriota bacterium]
MDHFHSRRDLLRLSPIALAAVTPAAFAAQAPVYHNPAHALTPLLFDVRHYGAKGDGKAVDTPAINAAIEAAAAAGGGTVYVPAGTYMCFSIRMRSNVHLYLAQGSVIQAADSPLPGQTTGYMGGTYDAAEPKTSYDAYQDYGHNHWHNSLVWGEDLHDFSITGPGLIFGKGLSFGGGRNPRGNYQVFIAEQPGVGNKAIALKNCRNVTLRDFSILKGGHFGLLLTGVDNLTIDNLTIDTDRDGMDIDCCQNVRVSNCFVNSPWDDGICPKSSFALGYARPTRNVTITNCYVSGYYELGTLIDGTFKKFAPDAHVPRNGRIKCGTESNGGFINITISNCVCEGSKGISIETSDGAFAEDIAISNITMRDTVDAPLFLRLNRRNRGPAESMRPGTLRRVLISNLVSYNSASSTASILSGVPGNLIEDVKLSNCYFGHRGLPTNALIGWGENAKPMPDWHTINVPELEPDYPELLRFGPTPAGAFFIRHLNRLEMSHVEVAPANPDPRPSFHLEDVHRADFFAITAPSSAAAFRLKQVTDLRIGWSRAAKDTQMASVDDQTL